MRPFEEDEALGKAYDWRLIRRFLGYVRPHRALVLLSLAIVLAGIVAEVAGPLLVYAAIDGPIAAGDVPGLWLYAAAFFGVVVASCLLEAAEHYFSNLAGQRTIYDLRNQTFRHLQRMPAAYYDRNPVGRLLVRVTNDIENLSELFTSGLIVFCSDVLLILALMATMFVIDWRMTLLTAGVAAPLVIGSAWLFRRYARETYRESRRAIARLNSYLNESVGGVKTIQIFNREETCFGRFEERNREYREKAVRAVLVYSFFWPAIELISAIALGVILVYAAHGIQEGWTRISAFIAFWYLFQKLFKPVRELAEKYNIFQSAMASSERIFKLLDTEPGIVAPAEPKSPPRRGEIAFENVGFSYDGRTPVLQDVSFRVAPGEEVAIVGFTGAGKTTLVNLLLRLYDVTSGRVLVDGVDVREHDPQELRRRFGLASQDVFLFSGTVEENLRLGNEIPLERIEESLRTVNAERIVARLPRGYQTRLGERGSALSAGERQLLSFGRALVFDPPALILDEATSSVDSETEARVQEALERMLRGRTVLMIAHRLSTVQRADRILVLHRGRLREEGSHEELLKKEGLYRKLCRLHWQPTSA